MPTISPELTWVAADTGVPSAEVAAGIEHIADAATRADGTPPLSEQVLRHLRHPGAEHLLARAGRPTDGPPPDGVGSSPGHGGTLVGYAQLDRSDPADPVAELVVHPGHRRSGTGTALLAALVERAPALRVWAHGGHPGAAALAARYGMRVVRELWRMRRSLTEPPADPLLPDGVALRTFVVGADEAELLRVNNAAFSWHPEQGGWTPADVAQRETEPWFDPDGLLLAVEEADPAHVLGFHWTKVHPAGADGTDPTSPIGEVYVLGVDPAARGRRLGPALTSAGLIHLRDRGLGAAMLYVEADNTAAVRVYRDLGFTPWGTDVSYRR